MSAGLPSLAILAGRVDSRDLRGYPDELPGAALDGVDAHDPIRGITIAVEAAFARCTTVMGAVHVGHHRLALLGDAALELARLLGLVDRIEDDASCIVGEGIVRAEPYSGQVALERLLVVRLEGLG